MIEILYNLFRKLFPQKDFLQKLPLTGLQTTTIPFATKSDVILDKTFEQPIELESVEIRGNLSNDDLTKITVNSVGKDYYGLWNMSPSEECRSLKIEPSFTQVRFGYITVKYLGNYWVGTTVGFKGQPVEVLSRIDRILSMDLIAEILQIDLIQRIQKIAKVDLLSEITSIKEIVKIDQIGDVVGKIKIDQMIPNALGDFKTQYVYDIDGGTSKDLLSTIQGKGELKGFQAFFYTGSGSVPIGNMVLGIVIDGTTKELTMSDIVDSLGGSGQEKTPAPISYAKVSITVGGEQVAFAINVSALVTILALISFVFIFIF